MVVCYPPDDVPMMEDPDHPGKMIPDDTWLITDDGAPVDGPYWEKQMHLLTEPLFLSWEGPDGDGDFHVFSNVGLFFSPIEPPIVPDVMLAVRTFRGRKMNRRTMRSYFVWRIGKVPEVAIEIVANRVGGEDTRKLKKYASIGVPWYIVFDPEYELSGELLRIFRLKRGRYQLSDETFFPEVQLGVKTWEGNYEDWDADAWLRWCDRDGNFIPTGSELLQAEHKRTRRAKQRAEQEKQRAEHEKQRADRLASMLRQHGITPPNGANE